jgi:hypothetical protein
MLPLGQDGEILNDAIAHVQFAEEKQTKRNRQHEIWSHY